MLQPQLVLEPFERWELDYVGPINPPSQHKVYILVCIYYVTKWVEAIELTRETDHVIENFIFEEVFAQYGVPREIVTDGGA